MTTPFWCLIVVMFIPLPLAFMGAAARTKAFGTADNKLPRLQVAKLDDQGARVYGAQANAWEATIMFAVTIIVTHLAGLDPAAAAPWAIGFVVARVAHAATYVLDIDKLRSGSFMVGLVCLIALLVKAA